MMFPTHEQIIEEHKDKAFILVAGDFTPTGLVTSRVSISKALLEMMGHDDEMLMVKATKFGQLAMGDQDSFQFMTINCFDQLLNYLQSQIAFKQLAKEKNLEKIREVIEKLTVRDRLRTFNRDKELVEWSCTMKTLTPSTLIVVFEEPEDLKLVGPTLQ